ncbi:TIGR03986 family CRISPR-associated RAMP protein, partial [Roseiflexus sp.]|uniref:TIGR03986 family type III CRISPR-associated RAMP protein n=1 Tax=Roseiflexus sp. TaxID=2562120 RepID=UPI00398B8D22
MSNTRPKRKPNVQKVPGNTTIPRGYRFLNPYNFVRTLETRNVHRAPLLGRCSPPPHDRMIGLSGRIRCRLTATTPIFVSDSEGVIEENVNGKIHRHYRFFRDPEGKIAIPATSLRGAVRSIFEAATNSCFAHIAGDKRLSYHLLPDLALQLVPARVQRSNGCWELVLLPGTTTITPGWRPSGPQYAAWVHVYNPLRKSGTVSSTTPYAGRKKLSLVGYRHGDEVYALIELVNHPHRGFQFWNVVHLARSKQELPKPTGMQRIVSGYLCLNNQNIENKHDERLFFTTQQLPPVILPDDVRQRYEELIADYQERHKDEVRKRREPQRPYGGKPAFSRFILERTGRSEAKLQDGDLVYAMLAGNPGAYSIEFIVPVSVPRVGFDRTIGELLSPADLKKCADYHHLCPACRTFGWVWGDESVPEAPDLSTPTAYVGRVRFSHATLTHDAGTFDATLAILSTPKPTTYRFYLRPRNGQPRNGLSDQDVDYNNPEQILRGRKFYRHHGAQLNWQEYCSVDGAKSDQNRTVLGVQQTGSEFIFTVEFTNLAPVELGALLWSLRLEGWHHRIGYAKPLGFGSAQIDIQEMEILDPEARYASLSAGSGWIKADDQQINLWINLFKKEMGSRYGAAFDQLANIRDLKALLGEI